MDDPKHYDVVLIGAGLANCLIALRLRALKPEIKLLLVEQQEAFDINRTWSFHMYDVQGLSWVNNLISKKWNGYSVSFPTVNRNVGLPYASIKASDFYSKVTAAFADRIHFGVKVISSQEHNISLSNGETLTASVILKGTGAEDYPESGFQKFVGWDVELESEHGLSSPILMDSNVDQIDGYRFIYVLPWDKRSLLIEDTRYSITKNINLPSIEESLSAYAQSKNWKVKKILRREQSALPIPFFMSIAEDFHPTFRVGLSANLFHPTTGYSFGYAAKLAHRVSSLREFTPENVKLEIRSFQDQISSNQRFYCFLNRLLFRVATPNDRYRIFERFYNLPDELIARFYSGDSTLMDRARIFFGKPPVSVLKTVRYLSSEFI